MSNIKKFKELSSDIEDQNLELDIDKLKGEYQIEEILDVFLDPKDIPVSENFSGINLSNKELKRGELVYMSALVKKNGHSQSSPAIQCVVKLRVVDIYNGLQYLNKVLNQ